MTEHELPYTLHDVSSFVYTEHKNNDFLANAFETQCECGIFDWYFVTAAFAMSKHFKNYVDIGCAYGLQSEVVTKLGLNYYGIDAGKEDMSDMYINKKSDATTEYFLGYAYPFNRCAIEWFDNKIPEHTIAVSHLCLGWNCFFPSDYDKKIAIKQMVRDFDTVILQTQNDNIPFLEDCYSSVQKLSDVIHIEKVKKILYDDEMASTLFCQK